MARVTYQDAWVTEYDNGTEEVRFSEEEWERMLADPAYGYVCNHGHRLNDSDRQYITANGICPHCEWECELDYFENHPDEEML